MTLEKVEIDNSVKSVTVNKSNIRPKDESMAQKSDIYLMTHFPSV